MHLLGRFSASIHDAILLILLVPGIPVSLKPDKEFSEMEEEFTLWWVAVFFKILYKMPK